jgi:hypothetical protein
MKGFPKAEFITYCIFVAVFAAAMIGSLDLGLVGFSDLGPGGLPFAASCCILGTSIGLIGKTFLQRKKTTAGDLHKAGWTGWIRVGTIVLYLALWPLLVSVVGYVISTWLALLGMAKSIGFKGWVQPILLSTFVALAIWFLFGFMFEIDLPSWFFD